MKYYGTHSFCLCVFAALLFAAIAVWIARDWMRWRNEWVVVPLPHVVKKGQLVQVKAHHLGVTNYALIEAPVEQGMSISRLVSFVPGRYENAPITDLMVLRKDL